MKHNLACESVFVNKNAINKDALVAAFAMPTVANEHTLSVRTIILHLSVKHPLAIFVLDVSVLPYVGLQFIIDSSGIWKCHLGRGTVITSPLLIIRLFAFLPVFLARHTRLGTIHLHIAIIGLEVTHIVAIVIQNIAIGQL